MQNFSDLRLNGAMICAEGPPCEHVSSIDKHNLDTMDDVLKIKYEYYGTVDLVVDVIGYLSKPNMDLALSNL